MKTLLLTLVISLSAIAESNSDYYIDSYDKGTYELYVITIRGCQTVFKISKDEHEELPKNIKAINQMVAIAINRSKNGCR